MLSCDKLCHITKCIHLICYDYSFIITVVSLSLLPADYTFTLSNVTAAIRSVQDWDGLGLYLGVPGKKRWSKEEMLQYFFTTVPNASWETLAGGLCYQQEHAALETVKEYLQPQPGIILCVWGLWNIL